jgi:Protein of unknown function (DUF664)
MTGERVHPPLEADERATLTAFLDFQRATLALKCADLTDDQLRERAVPPSGLMRACAPLAPLPSPAFGACVT